jgi:hypothetical protein
MTSMAGTLVERLKVKAKDGRELPYVRFSDGVTAHATRVTIAAVFEHDGKKGVRFEAAQQRAIAESMGLPADTELYFDLFPNDRAAAPPATPVGGTDW